MKKLLLSLTVILAASSINAQVVYSENFTNAGTWTAAQQWTSVDVDQDGKSWGLYNLASAPAPFSSFGICAGSKSWDTVALTPNNYFVSPIINLSSLAGLGAELSFKVASIDGDFFAEHYSVYAATTQQGLASATALFTETLADSLVHTRTVNLSSMAGQPVVYIAFRHYDCSDENIFFIDDVTITGVAGLQEIILDTKIYPNPATDMLNVEVNDADFSSAKVFTLEGKLVITSNTSSISVSELNPGMYILEVIGSNGGSSKSTFVKK